YFQNVRAQSVVKADSQLQDQAIKLLRAYKASTFENAELSVIGREVAVRFVAGKGRRKFHVEPLDEKTKGQVHVENLFFGVFRLLVALAISLQMVEAGMSIATVSKTPTVTVFVILGHLITLALGAIVSMETVNANASLFSSSYGQGRITDEGHVRSYGIGLWLLGARRWLYRALAYAVLASRDPLDSDMPASLLLPEELFKEAAMYSRLTLMLASFTALALHVLHIRFPTLLKAPWNSPLHKYQPTATSDPEEPDEASDEHGRQGQVVTMRIAEQTDRE
ncbi:hypothetical protein BaRGS_00021426, partial [Batillaria attramentaria]